MDLINSLFEYLHTNHIAICKTHCQGVLLSQVASHLDSGHRELTAAARKGVASAARAYTAWALSAKEVVYPHADAQPIEYLPLYKDGLQCKVESCGYTVRSLQNIQDHCKKEHG